MGSLYNSNEFQEKLKLALTGEKNEISTFPIVMPFVARKDNTCTYTHRI
jgi:hypothetical protein